MPLIDLMDRLGFPTEGSLVVGAIGAVRGVFTLGQLRATVLANRQTGASYTAVLDDAGREIERDNAGANTTTIPSDSLVAWPAGAAFTVARIGAGTSTIVAGAGVTLRYPASRTLAIAEQYEIATCRRLGANEWLIGGGLGAA